MLLVQLLPQILPLLLLLLLVAPTDGHLLLDTQQLKPWDHTMQQYYASMHLECAVFFTIVDKPPILSLVFFLKMLQDFSSLAHHTQNFVATV